MNLNQEKTIGIIGGVGPEAGVSLLLKIIQETEAHCDKDHLYVHLLSNSRIPDRSAFILKKSSQSPAPAIEESICRLKSLGAEVLGIGCNTAHSDEILGTLSQDVLGGVCFVNMVQEVYNHIVAVYGASVCVGLLATEGTYASKIYHKTFKNLLLVSPSAEDRRLLHETIYAIKEGKMSGAREALQAVSGRLVAEGAEVLVLGCTELPLAVSSADLPVDSVDSLRILARALIREAAPWKLKEYAPVRTFQEEVLSVARDVLGLLSRKNALYQDAYREQGLVGILLRSMDKIHRAMAVSKHSASIKEGVGEESLYDTISDLAGYCLLFLKEYRGS